jgi:hypothetical protein
MKLPANIAVATILIAYSLHQVCIFHKKKIPTVELFLVVSGARFEIECAVEYKNQGADTNNRLVATSHKKYSRVSHGQHLIISREISTTRIAKKLLGAVLRRG